MRDVVRIIIIIIGLVITSCPTFARADNYTDAAYCIGANQSESEETAQAEGNGKRAMDHVWAAESRRYQRQSFVESAIKQGKIDPDTASKLKSLGYADGRACSQQMNQCTFQWFERLLQQVDDESNEKQKTNC